ncbi:MAG: DUF3248 domain-containing protein [Deinococcales bacterium]
MKQIVQKAAEGQGVDERVLEQLANQLLWRIGRIHDDGPVIIRIGYATYAKHFADMPRLRNVSDSELEQAFKQKNLQVEWVGR